MSIILCLIALWLVITACTISSIISQPFSRKQRFFWITLVVVLPIVGILAYLPFSFNKEEIPDIFLMKQKRGKKRSGAGSGSRRG